jgi:DNA-directed RNA polymerase subunit RPC12/RpoP
MERETASYKCPNCRRTIIVLADEYADHPCSCGWDPDHDEEEEE